MKLWLLNFIYKSKIRIVQKILKWIYYLLMMCIIIKSTSWEIDLSFLLSWEYNVIIRSIYWHDSLKSVVKLFSNLHKIFIFVLELMCINIVDRVNMLTVNLTDFAYKRMSFCISKFFDINRSISKYHFAYLTKRLVTNIVYKLLSTLKLISWFSSNIHQHEIW